MAKRRTLQEFIQIAKSIHKNAYDYSQTIYVNKRTKVKIWCKKCKKFFYQLPDIHLHNKAGCPVCGRNRANKKTSLTISEFIKKAQKIHGNKYNYTHVKYTNSTTKVMIWCNDCKCFFYQTPNVHLSGSGCPKCAKFRILTKIKFTTAKFIEKAKKIHKDKYDYSEVNYITKNIPVKIQCNTCKKYFMQIPTNHLQGHGCPHCANAVKGDINRLTTEQFIEKAIHIHKNKYNYEKVNYTNSRIHVKIYCNKCKKYFMQSPNVHLSGKGCPNCTISYGENKIQDYLDENKITYIKQKRFKDCRDKRSLPFDFYLPEYNLCIEFQGEQHYKDSFYTRFSTDLTQIQKLFDLQKYHDQIKKKYCKTNNINFLEITYKDNIANKLYKKLKSLNK